MSNYITSDTHQMSNTKKLANKITSLISQQIKSDREFFVTQLIDILIETGNASSVSQASKAIAKMTDLTPQAIAFYYRGDKTNE